MFVFFNLTWDLALFCRARVRIALVSIPGAVSSNPPCSASADDCKPFGCAGDECGPSIGAPNRSRGNIPADCREIGAGMAPGADSILKVAERHLYNRTILECQVEGA